MSATSGLTLAGIAAMGAAGAVSRHLVGAWVASVSAARLPTGLFGLPGPLVGTLVVNVVGSFLLGLLAGLAVHRAPSHLRVAVTTGFLGSFTTFSTFSVQTMQLAERSWGLAALNLGMELGLGLVAAGLGLACARALG